MSALKNLITAGIDLILPPRCIGSGEIVGRQGAISPSFFSQLTFITDPMCATCGTPFGFDVPADTLCGHCMESPPKFDRARAAMVYNDASRDIVLGFKYGDKLHAAKTFAPWMARAGGDLLKETDVIMPVPLHRNRLWSRRFNQSAILADALAALTLKYHLPDGLIRLRATPPQKGLSRNERKNNVRGAFCVNGRYGGHIAGKNVMLIDDVFTSGATLNECARSLRTAGAEKIFVLTLARATKEDFA